MKTKTRKKSKVCTKCKRRRSTSQFQKDSGSKDGFASRCTDCKLGPLRDAKCVDCGDTVQVRNRGAKQPLCLQCRGARGHKKQLDGADPTPEEIRAMCESIKRNWTTDQLASR